MQPSKILIVDDVAETRFQILRWLNKEGYQVDEAVSGENALERIKTETYSVVLLDLRLPQMDGFKVLRHIRTDFPDTCVIILTAYADPESVKHALQAGAFDFFEKPIRFNTLLARIESAIEKFNMAREQQYQAEEDQERYSLDKIVGNCPKIIDMKNQIVRVAKTEASVLILGESGTGKELVAKAVHYNSRRCNKPLMIVDCSTITPTLIESELFGHEKGAFTGAYKKKKGKLERANEGTLFIDEIGELDHSLQMKLLRFLQEGTIERVGGEEVIKVDARILAATAVDLIKAIETQKFRTDLFYRLNVVTIEIPPLRERKEDIPRLVDHFIKIYSRKNLKQVKSISSEARRLLMNYDFRGNVRELENIIHRAVVLTDSDEIQPEVIGFDLLTSQQAAFTKYFDLPIREFSDACERDYLVNQLNKYHWHITNTAKAIGIDRSNLTLKMKRHGISNHR